MNDETITPKRAPGRPRKQKPDLSRAQEQAAPTPDMPGQVSDDILAGGRMSREWETRAADQVHEPYNDDWEPKGLLSSHEVPPFVDPESGKPWPQKWVRTKLNGNPDPQNVTKHLNQGWSPRPVDTIPHAINLPLVNDHNFGQMIGFHGVVLMFRHPVIHARQRAAIDRQTELQDLAVKTNPYKDGSALGGMAGNFRVPEMEVASNSRVTVGERPAPVAGD